MTTKDMKARIEELRELEAKATPLPHHIDRYEHGGGRVSVLDDGVRHLVADYFYEADRELHIALRSNASWLLDLAASALDDQEDLLAAVKTLREAALEIRDWPQGDSNSNSSQEDFEGCRVVARQALADIAKYEETT